MPAPQVRGHRALGRSGRDQSAAGRQRVVRGSRVRRDRAGRAGGGERGPRRCGDPLSRIGTGNSRDPRHSRIHGSDYAVDRAREGRGCADLLQRDLQKRYGAAMIRRIEASRHIDARPAVIHGVIADYRDGHRRIVPPKAFLWLAVDKGGIGAGTEIRFAMRVLGKARVSRGLVTEPEPGRTIVETYPDTGDVTTFTVDPRRNGAAALVTIATDLHVPDGIMGRIQGYLAE